MSPRRAARRTVVSVIALLLGAAPATSQGRRDVVVVDMIPRWFSNESYQNSEPSLAMNPRDPHILASASYAAGANFCRRGVQVPVFFSQDGGDTWAIVCKVGIDSIGGDTPADLLLRWSPEGTVLFASMIWPVSPITMQVLRTANVLDPLSLALYASYMCVDQPDLAIVSWKGEPVPLVAGNYKLLGNGTAAVWNPLVRMTEIAIPPARIEHRPLQGQNYAVRLAAHPSGTVYAAFMSPRIANKDHSALSDVVVVRDDSAGTTAAGLRPFRALREARFDGDTGSGPTEACSAGDDGLPGVRVARCVPVPWHNGPDSLFGQQRRTSSALSIAVDPRDPMHVAVAWGDSTPTDRHTVHLRRSRDGGRTWGADLLTIPLATNPAIAFDDSGSIGLLVQQLVTRRGVQRWQTRLRISADGFRKSRTVVLASVPVRAVRAHWQPYLGDYVELRAVGRTFMGVFSAANVPDVRNFPSGVSFLRNVDRRGRRLLTRDGTAEVVPSIDPFFFRVGKLPPPPPASPVGAFSLVPLNRPNVRMGTPRVAGTCLPPATTPPP